MDWLAWAAESLNSHKGTLPITVEHQAYRQGHIRC